MTDPAEATRQRNSRVADKLEFAVINNHDDAFRAVAFMNRHLLVAAARAFASPSVPTEEVARLRSVDPIIDPPSLPIMREAFRTTVSGCGSYTMVFKFPTMEAMHAADDEWIAFRAALAPIAGKPE